MSATKWIGNERKRKKSGQALDDTNQQTKRHCRSKPQTTGYNLFCSYILNSDTCQELSNNSDKLKMAVTTWNSLTVEEQECWKKKAKDAQSANPIDLSNKERHTKIKKAKKQLISQLAYLESLGCTASVLLLEPGESPLLQQYGTNEGLHFLEENQNVALKFMEYMNSPQCVKYTMHDVRELFRRKYSEACGKPIQKVPYSKGGFVVSGLPDEIEFRNPSTYGQKQIQKIMNKADDIAFCLQNPAVKVPSQVTVAELAVHKQILVKLVTEETATASLSNQHQILEEDLEVCEFDLTASEFNILTTQLRDYFHEDAITALESNFEAGRGHQGYILPVYTTTSDAYWLFYHPGTADEIENLQPEDPISGYWLDKTEQELHYKLLVEPQEASIVALNLINDNLSELGSLRVRKHLDTEDELRLIAVSADFDYSVKECLRKHGFDK
ncbi:uncharacterized protein LOC114540760 isoform X2 [Dendronephthya gigantea]|uniref:uncharacterized protein LOC114518980 isoform X2 n=1 Tax=Dendronephthya gigantea TaxID=151771 RepID=UPI00106DD06C|nr:uncharacterized protein LOC114518980 isoform X2 [Dendronephthya gigantea]XP_028405789.1 uncharacterized protein LOC114528371 isoform X2 [Dendronephthya gigantea]XP_028414808.1 uncharacterized protein LOC114537894 isoform X2 [Dendronephthya gigantea]XP_028415589.1 uncharacterized protein LOC114538939 isoform X2 [Dendronephthya gigantea]XP_028416668.1 uncharacterized protein LOC114540760 isoform X2 [Dendronephthya gigantea]